MRLEENAMFCLIILLAPSLTYSLSQLNLSTDTPYMNKAYGEEKSLVKMKFIAKQKGDSVVIRALSALQNKVDIYDLHLTLDAETVNAIKPPQGWDVDVAEGTGTIQLFTNDSPLKPGKSILFKIETDAKPMLCSWEALDKNGVQVAIGSMKARVAKG